jgi:hypothetical protein
MNSFKKITPASVSIIMLSTSLFGFIGLSIAGECPAVNSITYSNGQWIAPEGWTGTNPYINGEKVTGFQEVWYQPMPHLNYGFLYSCDYYTNTRLFVYMHKNINISPTYPNYWTFTNPHRQNSPYKCTSSIGNCQYTITN